MNQLFNNAECGCSYRAKYTHHDRLMDEGMWNERMKNEEDDSTTKRWKKKYEAWLVIT